jgi:hypothetical protein
VIVSVSSFDTARWPQDDCFKIGKSEVATNGYGLFTRTRALSGFSNLLPVGQNTAAPYANIIVAVFQSQPVALAAYGRAPCSKVSLPDFPWASSSGPTSSGFPQKPPRPVSRTQGCCPEKKSDLQSFERIL